VISRMRLMVPSVAVGRATPFDVLCQGASPSPRKEPQPASRRGCRPGLNQDHNLSEGIGSRDPVSLIAEYPTEFGRRQTMERDWQRPQVSTIGQKEQQPHGRARVCRLAALALVMTISPGSTSEAKTALWLDNFADGYFVASLAGLLGKMRHAGRRPARQQHLQNRTPWPVSACTNGASLGGPS
jgi:hypothetical protein